MPTIGQVAVAAAAVAQGAGLGRARLLQRADGRGQHGQGFQHVGDLGVGQAIVAAFCSTLTSPPSISLAR